MRSILLRFSLIMFLLAPSASAVVTIEWVTVSGPSIPTPYMISKFEITNAQYTEFLNAIASTDPLGGRYHTSMGLAAAPNHGGITRSGGQGSYAYATIAGREDMPVNWVSFRDVQHFVNWMHNGQPTGLQDATTTTDGAYTLDFSGLEDRNLEATIFVPDHDEWFDAAYYDPVSDGVFVYPYGTSTITDCSTPSAMPNRANCESAVGDLTDVGSYPGSVSPHGSFDMGGNIREWTEERNGPVGPSFRVHRGGSFGGSRLQLAVAALSLGVPGFHSGVLGFRLASPVNPPATAPSLTFLATILLGSLLGFAGLHGLRA